MRCYCLSGLGADSRAFQYISVSNYELFHIEWIEPRIHESLSNYCIRLSQQINTNNPFIILGISFGGIIACELAKILLPQKTIILSSITDKNDLPFIFQLVGKYQLYKFIPASLLKPPAFLAFWFFGVRKQKSKVLLKDIIADTDVRFLRWAIEKILNKEPIFQPPNLIKIHGTKDKLLPITKDETIIKIENGGHFMVIDNADEINTVLAKILSESRI